MPKNLIVEFTLLQVRSGEKWLPPFVALTADRDRASRAALEWAETEFGSGDYRVVGGRFVGRMQGNAWGEVL
jgi:hypothetical protein